MRRGRLWAAGPVILAVALAAPAVAAQNGDPVQVSSGATEYGLLAAPEIAAASGGSKLVVWPQQIEREPERYQIWARVLDPADRPVGEPFPISSSELDGQPASASSSAIAATPDGQGFLVIWSEGTGDAFHRTLMGTHISTVGQLAADRFVIAASGVSPDLAYNPEKGEYVVVWTARGREIRGQRLRPDGSLVGESFRVFLGSQ